MKKILIILLFSFILCGNSQSTSFFTTALDSIQCLLKSNKLIDSFFKIIEVIKTKDLLQILNTCYTIYLDLKEELNKCNEKPIKNKKVEEIDEDIDIKLGYPSAVYLLYTKFGEDAFKWFDKGGYKLLKENCYKSEGQNSWICNYIRKEN